MTWMPIIFFSITFKRLSKHKVLSSFTFFKFSCKNTSFHIPFLLCTSLNLWTKYKGTLESSWKNETKRYMYFDTKFLKQIPFFPHDFHDFLKILCPVCVLLWLFIALIPKACVCCGAAVGRCVSSWVGAQGDGGSAGGKDAHGIVAMLPVPNEMALSVSKLSVPASQLGEDLELLTYFLRGSTHFTEKVWKA